MRKLTIYSIGVLFIILIIDINIILNYFNKL